MRLVVALAGLFAALLAPVVSAKEEGCHRIHMPLERLRCYEQRLSANVRNILCAGRTLPAERLSCYDLFAGRAGFVPLGKGDWNVHSELEPVDDSQTVVVSLKSRIGATFSAIR